MNYYLNSKIRFVWPQELSGGCVMNAGPRYVWSVALHDVEGPVLAHRHLHVVAGVAVQEIHLGVTGGRVSA